jgi:hypothetical protein
MNKQQIIKQSSKIIAVSIVIVIMFYILFANTIPFNISRTYSSNDGKFLVLTPKNRVRTINGIARQAENLIYFNSPMLFKFDKAKVRVTFKNNNHEAQQILIGYKDQREWHYNTQILDNPTLDKLNWQKIGGDPYLYQRLPSYRTVNEFIKHPPRNKVVGVADYKNNDLLQSNTSIPNYSPSKTKTSIDVPLRGKTVLYTYLSNEVFDITFTKKDLNWQKDPDVAKISVFKDKDKVFDATIDDDGNATSNHKPGRPESVNIKNPGPGLPEAGVYRIVIDASDDSLITNISTTLHKISFEGPLYVADNHEVYGDIAPKTKTTNLVTNAQKLSFRSDHDQSKSVMVDKTLINITKPNQVFTATNSAPIANISIPKSDMIANGSGYFAFNSDQFFEPTPYKILPINSPEDIAQADYIITNYKEPKYDGQWIVAETEFDISNAEPNKGKLSWIISTPGLKENNHAVEYKQIDMTLSKKGWFKQ